MKEGILMAISTTLKQIRTERNICQEDLAVAIIILFLRNNFHIT